MRIINPTIIILCLFFSFSNTVLAEQTPSFEQGKTYFEIANAKQLQTKKNKIEVLAFLWYGCGGCYAVEPKLIEWSKTAPENVHFQLVPALFGGIWDIHGKIMLTLNQMNVDPTIHKEIFDAIQLDKKKLTTMSEMKETLKPLGIDVNKFESIYNSIVITSSVNYIKNKIKDYQLQAVPAVVINGKYRFNISNVNSVDDFIKLINFLVEKESQANKVNVNG